MFNEQCSRYTIGINAQLQTSNYKLQTNKCHLETN
jgi:hypothetical protein